jgi:hypothetical protein
MLQTTADFFLEALCLLLYSHNDDTMRLVREVLSIYNDDKESPEFQDVKVEIYASLIRDLLAGDVDAMSPAEISAFKLKVMQNPTLAKDPELLERIRPVFANDAKISPRRIQALVQRVTTFVILHRSNKTIRKMYATGRAAEDASDPEKQTASINAILEYARDLTRLYDHVSIQNMTTVDMIDFTDLDSVQRAIIQNQKSCNSDTIWKLGLQGLSRAFTKWRGGIRRGTFGAVIACSGNYKSGMMLDMCRWFCTLNKPVVKPGTIPTIVFFSLENEPGDNVVSWYKALYINMFKKLPPPEMPPEEMARFVKEKMTCNGFKLLMYRELGESFGLEEYRSKLNKLIAEGHDIQACFIDYLGLMKISTVNQENTAKARQVLAGHIANYGKHLGITTITGWQMTGEADGLSTTGGAHVVKKFGNNHLADAKGFARELDWQMFLHCEKNHVELPFLTGKLHKLRYSEGGRSSRDDFWAYQFHPELGILDDIDGIDRSVPDIYTVAEDGDSTSDRLFGRAG